jgi:YbbR domain-containing protein
VPAPEPAEGEALRRRLWRTAWRRIPPRRRIRELVRHNALLKVVSLLVACFLWYSINELERDAERVVDLPVGIRRVAPGLIVTDVSPAKGVMVTLRGPRTILDNVDEGKTRLVVDLSSAGEGEVRVDLNRASLVPELPRRLKVVRMTPGRLDAKLEKLAKRRLAVKPVLAGAPGVGYRVAESTLTPDHVEVTGPAKTLDAMKEVSTRPIDLDGLTSTLERTALLDAAGDFVNLVPDRVRVSVRFDEILMSREFPRVPIALRNGDQAKITPAQVDVTVHGPQRLLHDWVLPAGAVFVDAAGLGPGTHPLPVQVDLPAPLEVTARQPETVRVVVAAKEQGGP